MWIADVPPQQIELPAIYLAANAISSQQEGGAANKLGVCRSISGNASIFPTSNAASYFTRLNHQNFVFDFNADGSLRMDIAIRIIGQPKHGKLLRVSPDAENLSRYEFKYIPDENYEGFDDFAIETSAGGKTVKIYYTMSVVLPGEPTTVTDWTCPKGTFWKISANLDANGNTTINSVEYLPADGTSTAIDPALATSFDASGYLSNFISNTSNVPLSFADLAAGALGQTTSTSITLDDNAAGNTKTTHRKHRGQ